HQVADLGEDLLGLTVGRAVAEDAALTVARGHAGDEDLVAVDPAVRPRAGRRLFHVRTDHALHRHDGSPRVGIGITADDSICPRSPDFPNANARAGLSTSKRVRPASSRPLARRRGTTLTSRWW